MAVDAALGHLERGLEVEDRADGLHRHDAAGAERRSVANAVDFVAHRLLVITTADEVGAERVHVEPIIDGGGGGTERLGDDLSAVEPAPRVTGPAADEGVGTVVGKLEKLRELHPVLAERRWRAKSPGQNRRIRRQ